MSDDKNVVDFQPRLINQWPRQVYLADFTSDGSALRVYESIQYPNDTTPLYVRGDIYQAQANRIEELEAENARLREALTPSGDTKAAYISEIECDCPTETWRHNVPWTSIKEIMKMIRARATLKDKEDA